MYGKCGLFLLFCVVLSACGERGDYPRRTAKPGFLENPTNIAAGRNLFMEHCASCHGTVSEGRMETANRFAPPPSDFADSKYRRLDPAYLYWRIERGNRDEPYRSRGSVMPAWGQHFGEEEIWALVAYIRTR